MNIGLFGGTFDPIHNGHIALARAAQERWKLGVVHFVPASVPPHKQQPVAPFTHRYVMVALATNDESRFIPSLTEAPKFASTGKSIVNYSIDTIRRLKQNFKKSDRLFFLIGIDAFKDIAKWREAEALFQECDFIVASRPGYSLADVANSLPESLRPKSSVSSPFKGQPASGDLVLPGATIHLLDNVHQKISATDIRDRIASKRTTKFLDPSVLAYIKKMGLYSS